jgi:hypothetical protein
MHWYASLLEGTVASCALRLEKALEPAKAKDRVRIVTEPNFIAASDMRNYAPSDSGRTDEIRLKSLMSTPKASTFGVSRTTRKNPPSACKVGFSVCMVRRFVASEK